jgi:uncharacterized RDD family membrane protein YckC
MDTVGVAHDGIVTPEAVVLELETAGVASRLLAALIDLCVTLGFVLVAGYAVAVTGGADSWGVSFMAFVVFAALLVLPVVEQMWMRGRTPGKAALGLRAVTLDGAPIRFRQAVLRTMGGLVDRLMPPGGITGLLFVLGTTRSQTIGDLVGGTVVVRDPQRWAPTAAVWFPVPPGLEGYAATLDPSRLTNEHYTVIRSFLLRARTLSPAARVSVANDLADRTAAQLGHDRPTWVHSEAFLLCAISRFQRRNMPALQPTSWTQR